MNSWVNHCQSTVTSGVEVCRSGVNILCCRGGYPEETAPTRNHQAEDFHHCAQLLHAITQQSAIRECSKMTWSWPLSKNVQDQGANVKIGEESRQQAWDIGIYLGINGKVHPAQVILSQILLKLVAIITSCCMIKQISSWINLARHLLL